MLLLLFSHFKEGETEAKVTEGADLVFDLGPATLHWTWPFSSSASRFSQQCVFQLFIAIASSQFVSFCYIL